MTSQELLDILREIQINAKRVPWRSRLRNTDARNAYMIPSPAFLIRMTEE